MSSPGEGLKGVVPELCVAEWVLDGPFEGPDPHYRRVDSLYVLEGDLEVTVAGSVHTAGRDTLLSVPGDARHSGVGRGRVLGIHAPDRGSADSLHRASG